MAEIEENHSKGEKEMSFLEHLEELRWHLIRSLAAIGIIAIVAFIYRDIIWHDIILAPSRVDFWTYRMFCKLAELTNSAALCIEDLPFIIQNRNMTAQFTIAFTSSFIIGLVDAFPYVFWEIWRFVKPGLYNEERNMSRGAVFFVTLLFLLGIMFGYYVVCPISINFLSHFQLDPSIQNEIDLTSYVSTIIMLTMACGIMFQLPMIVFVLAKLGVVTPAFLRTYRKHSIVVIFTVAAVLTPPDITSQIIMSVPLLILYEIGIYVARVVQKKEELRQAEESF